MAGCKCWKFARRFKIAGFQVVVIIVEELHKCVGIAFRMAARDMRRRGAPRGSAEKDP